ncbi:VQ motif-containing protein 25-like isoform X2 [Macadamia integrifolia]|uniref:VQ motif-containing protein 25-like isoform X2 n=1 Tax=Macadamia integrifolia TaxID=60698 RepID=UPI001C53161C|nr:VQ motif-containing protein 25-like isoform X2 [Macadamia integrifolia]
MKEMMKPHTCEPNRISSALAMHKGSHVISKFQPKIRIVHVFAPEIIKTDVANFRELVQRLTGKPPDHKRSNKKKAKSVISREESLISSFKPTKTRDLQDGSQRIKEEEEEREMWGEFTEFSISHFDPQLSTFHTVNNSVVNIWEQMNNSVLSSYLC